MNQSSLTTRLGEYISLILPDAHGHQQKAISDFVLALLSVRTCCQAGLARFFDNFEAASKRLFRLLHNNRLDTEELARAHAAALVRRLPADGCVRLALDWTVEDSQHLLVASLNVGRRAVPLYWRAYTDAELKGRMSFYEREFVRALFADALSGVARRRCVLTADRWFADVDLLDLLNELGVAYVIRTKANYHVQVEGRWRRLDSLRWMKNQRRRAWGRVWDTEGDPRHVYLVQARAHDRHGRWGIWHLPSNRNLSAYGMAAEYARHFTCEAGFREAKRLLGFAEARISCLKAWTRVLTLVALAIAVLTKLGCVLASDARRHSWLRRVRSRRTARSEVSMVRSVGAQVGHQGAGRPLKRVEEVDRVVDFRPQRCRSCGRRLKGDDPRPSRHQVTEIPPVQAAVTEYRRHALCCATCGLRTAAEWGAEVPEGSFGARLQAVIAYFTGRLGLSHRDASEALPVLHGVEISTGSISAVQRQVSRALQRPVETAHEFVRRHGVNHVDETSWRECSRLNWLWVHATREVTTFQLAPRRDAATAREVIGSAKHSIITTDRYLGYSWLATSRRQVCWAHLKRDFQAMAERGGESQKIGEALLAQTKEVFGLWHQVRDGHLSRRKFQKLMLEIEPRVKELLDAGSDCASAKTRGTCRQMRRLEAALWTFARVGGVEPTNNDAERKLRRAVLWRRKSFGTQSEAGSRFVERILTVIITLRQQGRDVMEYLTTACISTLGENGSICLLPDSS